LSTEAKHQQCRTPNTQAKAIKLAIPRTRRRTVSHGMRQQRPGVSSPFVRRRGRRRRRRRSSPTP